METKVFNCGEQMLRVLTKKVVKILSDDIKESVRSIVLIRTSRPAYEYILKVNEHEFKLLGYWNDCISGTVHIPFRDGIVFPFYSNVDVTIIEPRMLELVNKIFDWGYTTIRIK